jgi:hypothetical protein
MWQALPLNGYPGVGHQLVTLQIQAEAARNRSIQSTFKLLVDASTAYAAERQRRSVTHQLLKRCTVLLLQIFSTPITNRFQAGRMLDERQQRRWLATKIAFGMHHSAAVLTASNHRLCH